jgi:hypothetical protein
MGFVRADLTPPHPNRTLSVFSTDLCSLISATYVAGPAKSCGDAVKDIIHRLDRSKERWFHGCSPPGLTRLATAVGVFFGGEMRKKRRDLSQVKELIIELTSIILLLIAAVKLILYELLTK